jgi:hypothetical protein
MPRAQQTAIAIVLLIVGISCGVIGWRMASNPHSNSDRIEVGTLIVTCAAGPIVVWAAGMWGGRPLSSPPTPRQRPRAWQVLIALLLLCIAITAGTTGAFLATDQDAPSARPFEAGLVLLTGLALPALYGAACVWNYRLRGAPPAAASPPRTPPPEPSPVGLPDGPRRPAPLVAHAQPPDDA